MVGRKVRSVPMWALLNVVHGRACRPSLVRLDWITTAIPQHGRTELHLEDGRVLLVAESVQALAQLISSAKVEAVSAPSSVAEDDLTIELVDVRPHSLAVVFEDAAPADVH